MIRIPGWILGSAFVLVVAACGAGEQAEESQPPQATTPARPQPQQQTPSQPQTPPPQATAPAERRPVPSAATATDRLYTVQVGAFDSSDEARLWADRLSRRGYPTWTTEAVVKGRTFHRLRIGASPSFLEARGLGERITREFRWPVWIAPVEDNATVPKNAISRTRTLVSGS